MMSEEPTEEEVMQEAEAQGVGYSGELIVVWKGACIRCSHFPVIQTEKVTQDDTGKLQGGSLSFIFDSKGAAMSIFIDNNENIQAITDNAPEGKARAINECLEVVQSIIMRNMLDDCILMIDLDAQLNTFQRKDESTVQ